MDLNALSIAAHKNSADHGFWDPPPPVYMTRALIHSEVSEALEDVRAGFALDVISYPSAPVKFWKLDDPERPVGEKPCGFPSEIADIAIRVLDFAGRHKIHFDELPETGSLDALVSSFVTLGIAEVDAVRSEDAVFWLDTIHGLIPGIKSLRQTGGNAAATLAAILTVCLKIADICQFSLEAIVEEKMAYNASRPFKHGGKKF